MKITTEKDLHPAHKNLVVLHRPRSMAAEAYRNLRTSLQHAGLGTVVKSLAVTSPGHSEGKTATIANLGVSLAQTGKKVLILDANLRTPKLHLFFNRDNATGLAQCLQEEDPNAQCSRMQHISAIGSIPLFGNLNIITAGHVTGNPCELLDGSNFRVFVKRMEELHDIVLIDTPAASNGCDALVIGSVVDATLVVIAAGRTDTDTAKQCIESLENAGARILGSVLGNAQT